jgi:peptidoglycan/xylan/chitin deacetylase (PgdA/CDA1 family)
MTILCYHTVDAVWPDPVAVTPDDFVSHCRWLARHRRVVSLPEAVAHLRHGRLPRGVVALTFDDGFAAVHEHALPALRRHGLTATVFLVAGTLLPQGLTVDWIDPRPATPPATLSLAQIEQMAAQGITFGSHTMHHRDLTRMSGAECERDLRQSRVVLEDLLGRPVTLLAYPFGQHNAVVRRAARRAGYSHAFSLPGAGELPTAMSIPRVGVYRGNGLGTFWIKNRRGYLQARTTRIASLTQRAAAAVGEAR